MSRNKVRRGPLHAWEDEMITAYADRVYHEALDPLYEKFQEWKRQEVSHLDMDASIHFVHRELQKIYGMFNERRNDVLTAIVADPWFKTWSAEHPPPGDDEGEAW